MKTGFGFSLMEFIAALVIFGITLSLAVPSWSSFIQKKRLISATESIEDSIKLAHSESIKRRAFITLSYVSGANWCVGLSSSGNCNCNVSNACLVDGVERVMNSTQYPGVNMATTGFSVSSGLQFDWVRGVANQTGGFTMSNGTYQINLSVNKMGRSSSCSSTVAGYDSC